MNIRQIASQFARLVSLGKDIARLPVARLEFHARIHPDHIGMTHEIFTSRHPRYRVIANKTMGIALIDLSKFNTPADYLATVKRKDYAGYHAKRAKARGYWVAPINRNEHVDAIHRINTSAESRQGRPMDEAYIVKETAFYDFPHIDYLGVMDQAGQLMGYCNVANLGNFVATEKLIGIKNGDGFMYLLLTEIVCRLIKEKKVSYLMYDTYLGAQPGLRNFKRKLGFAPYRARYSLS